MNIHEYQAKGILKKYEIAVPNGVVRTSLKLYGQITGRTNVSTATNLV